MTTTRSPSRGSTLRFANRSARIGAMLGLSLAMVTGCSCDGDAVGDAVGDAPLGSTPYVFADGKVEHADAVQVVAARIESAQALGVKQPDAWRPRELEAAHWSTRATLSGDIADYVAADAAMGAAFERAPQGGGPWFGLASLSFTLHRLDAAEAALDVAAAAILVDDPTHAAIDGLRGDIELQRGEMQNALALMQSAEALDPSSQSAARLGLWQWRTGDLDAADEMYAQAQSRYFGREAQTLAWFDLQRGLIDLDRGAYADALAHYLDANAQLSGYYLVEEHVAEVLVRLGRPEEARFLYEAILQRNEAPEFMDALAGLHADAGEAEASAQWAAKAELAFDARLQLLPEVAAGHALNHFIEYGDPSRAVELARQNFELRSNPAARSSLALALAIDGQLEQARVHIDAAQQGAWVSFDLEAEAAEVYTRVGAPAQADAARERACVRAPLRCSELDAG